jgi:VanZ family protein
VSTRVSPLRIAIAIAVPLVVLAFLWSPPPPTPRMQIPFFDKYVHFALFAAIAVAWHRARMPAPWLLGLGLALGILTEVVQGLLPWPRTPDAWDVLADTLGLTLVLAIVRRLQPPPQTDSISLP